MLTVGEPRTVTTATRPIWSSAHSASFAVARAGRPSAMNANRQASCNTRPGIVTPSAVRAVEPEPLVKRATTRNATPSTTPNRRAVPLLSAMALVRAGGLSAVCRTSSGSDVSALEAPTANT